MKRSGLVSPHDRRATERWMNEGGHVASDAVLEREAIDDARRASTTDDRRATTPDEPGIAKLRKNPEPTALSRRARRRVVIAGGGSQDWIPRSPFTRSPGIAWTSRLSSRS
jgi:hypothetical protein